MIVALAHKPGHDNILLHAFHHVFFFFDFLIFLADFDESLTLFFKPLPIACGRFFSKSPEQFLNYCQKNEKCEIRHFENAAPGSKDSDFRNGKTFNFIWFLHRTTLYLQLDRERFFDFDFNFFFVNFWSWVLQEKKKGKNFLTLTTFTRSTGKNCENALDHVVDILFFYKMSHNMLILDIWCARNPLTHP